MVALVSSVSIPGLQSGKGLLSEKSQGTKRFLQRWALGVGEALCPRPPAHPSVSPAWTSLAPPLSVHGPGRRGMEGLGLASFPSRLRLHHPSYPWS